MMQEETAQTHQAVSVLWFPKRSITSSPEDRLAHAVGTKVKARSILLTFIRAHVTAASVLFIMSRPAALIGLQ
jgi:hypothetical protein